MRPLARPLAATLLVLSAASTANGQRIDLFDLPPGSAAQQMVAGPDGNLWFTDPGQNRILRLSLGSGLFSSYSLPTPGAQPWGIAAGPDGNLWFTEFNAGKVGRITPAGVITEFPLPACLLACQPSGIAAGPDGNLWFGERGSDEIGRITPSGAVTKFGQLYLTRSSAITPGPDGALWFTMPMSGRIGRIETDGSSSSFPIHFAPFPGIGQIVAAPDGRLWYPRSWDDAIGQLATDGTEEQFATGASPEALAFALDGQPWIAAAGEQALVRHGPGVFVGRFPLGTAPTWIARGPDDDLWFLAEGGSRFGRIWTTSKFEEFPLDDLMASPWEIAPGPDGNLWFSEADALYRLDPANFLLTSVPRPDPSTSLGLVSGPDGNLWFTESTWNRIVRMTTSGVRAEFAVPTSNAIPQDITAGPDGNLWFTEWNVPQIGRITPQGQVTEFPYPAPGGSFSIASGPDGNLWFAVTFAQGLGRVTPAGAVTLFPLPSGATPYELTFDDEGRGWVITGVPATLTAFDTSGQVVGEIPLPQGGTSQLAADQLGKLWAVAAGELRRVDAASAAVETVPGWPPWTAAGDLWIDDRGDLWFTGYRPPGGDVEYDSLGRYFTCRFRDGFETGSLERWHSSSP